jgi:hypothetical protein
MLPRTKIRVIELKILKLCKIPDYPQYKESFFFSNTAS